MPDDLREQFPAPTRPTSPTRCPASAGSASTPSGPAARPGLVFRRVTVGAMPAAGPGAARGRRRPRPGAARPRARDRPHGLGQDDDARVMVDLDQHAPRGPHRHDRGPDRGPAPGQAGDRQPARGRSTPRTSRVALRAAMRQDPDVILVGEMRDEETVRAALAGGRDRSLRACRRCTRRTRPRRSTASSTSSRRTSRSRSGSRWPASLRGIVCQRLVPRADGKGRASSVELCVNTGRIAEAIADPDKTADDPALDRRGRLLRDADLRPAPARPDPRRRGHHAGRHGLRDATRTTCRSSCVARVSSTEVPSAGATTGSVSAGA